jgi:hypothetical protein
MITFTLMLKKYMVVKLLLYKNIFISWTLNKDNIMSKLDLENNAKPHRGYKLNMENNCSKYKYINYLATYLIFYYIINYILTTISTITTKTQSGVLKMYSIIYPNIFIVRFE